MNEITPITKTDLELNGRVCKALHNGHDFAYWLAQMGPWADERPKLSISSQDKEYLSLPPNFYRVAALAASSADFVALDKQSQLLHQTQSGAFRLWQSMHPDPLSLYNDANRLDDEVVENCELHVRNRLRAELHTEITPDPTLLESIIPEERQWLT